MKLISRDKIIVTGHPNFSSLHKIKKDFNRKEILTRASLDADKKYFIFTTQYSEGNDLLLLNLIKTMEKYFSEYELIIAAHPNQDPSHYKELMNKAVVNYHILDRKYISVYEAMLASEIVFTETSTTGFEAILLDKDLIHIFNKDEIAEKHFNIRNNLALYSKNIIELKNNIISFLKNKNIKKIRDNVKTIVPIPDSKKLIIDFISSKI